MQGIWIIIAIVWIVIPIIAKKKQQQAKEQAARERAARLRAAQAAVQKQAETVAPMRTVPLAPTVRPSAQPAFEGSLSVEKSGSLKGTGSPEGTGSLEGTASRDEGTAAHTIASKLRELNQTPQHVVSASSISGHAHEETSMSGIRPDCPPDAKPAVTQVAPVEVQSNFLWDQTQILNGIVLSEILGPCIAMRD
jgi:type II secretory pathway pseudopilin PulG